MTCSERLVIVENTIVPMIIISSRYQIMLVWGLRSR